MKTKLLNLCLFTILATALLSAQINRSESLTEPGKDQIDEISASEDTVAALISILNELAADWDDELFKHHCNSIINVIQTEESISEYELDFINLLYTSFSDPAVEWSASALTSYFERKRPLIISWTSPTDGIVSVAWLLLPENWDPNQTYPLYVRLHGLWDPYSNKIEYMTMNLRPQVTMNTTFEDGYSIFPWGRGNTWYQGIGETDVFEGISALENLVHIDPLKKYLTGFSMGGYGTWYIGQRSPEVWAALGVYAGALWYGGSAVLSPAAAEKLKDVPVYFVCGDYDILLSNNQTAYQYLVDAGNPNLFFTTFPGGHESLLVNWQNMYNCIRNFSNEDPTSVETIELVSEFSLYQNYPNPFNPITKIKYSIPTNPPSSPFIKGGSGEAEEASVILKVYDILGNEVATLVNERKSPGIYEVEFDGSNLASGIYFCKMTATGRNLFQKTQKLILLK
ncbi:MAG: T9SS type A sorting domain-containing protein [bacterium]